MIISFGNKNTAKLFEDKYVKQYSGFERSARRKLSMIDAAESINDLRSPPGNRLEKLSGDLEGLYSIRINQKWRICFEWKKDNPYNVQIIDYH